MKNAVCTPDGDVICPVCDTENCWYIDNETSRDDHEIIVEIWLCENKHKFRYVLRERP